MYAINNNFSPNVAVRERLQSLHALLLSMDSSVSAGYIKGEHNIVSDCISRMHIGDAYQFNQLVFNDLQDISCAFTIDRFATAHNALLANFNTQFWELGSTGVDAFA